jgi:hypothetical protein
MPPVDPCSVPLGVYGNWPGIDEPGQVRVNRTRLRAIARRLEMHLEAMLSADKDLKPASQAAYGNWDAAQQFYPSVRAGHDALVDQHSRFLHAVMDMIKKLHRTAQAYDEAETDLEHRIREVDKRLNTAPISTSFASPNSLNPEGRG